MKVTIVGGVEFHVLCRSGQRAFTATRIRLENGFDAKVLSRRDAVPRDADAPMTLRPTRRIPRPRHLSAAPLAIDPVEAVAPERARQLV